MSLKPKIAILASHFGSQAVGAIRPGLWATWLASESYKVTIISFPNDNSLPIKFWNLGIQENLCVTPIDHITPHCSKLLIRASSLVANIFSIGIKLLKYLYSSAETVKPAVSFQRKNSQNIDVESNRIIRKPLGLFSYRFPSFFDFWIIWSFIVLCKIRPTIVIASHGPYATLIAAYLYAVVFPSTKLVADYRDMWTRSRLYTGIFFFRSIELSLEKLILSRSDAITTVSHGQACILRDIHPEAPISVIYNSSLKSSRTVTYIGDNNPPKANFTSKFHLLYTGTIYHQFQDLSPVLEKLFELRSIGLINPENFVFEVLSGQISIASELVDRYSMSDMVRLSPRCSLKESFDLQSSADCLLLLESSVTEAQGVMTSKLFDYLYSAKPILLDGVSISSEICSFVSRNGTLLLLNDLEAYFRAWCMCKTPIVHSYDQSFYSRKLLIALINSLSRK